MAFICWVELVSLGGGVQVLLSWSFFLTGEKKGVEKSLAKEEEKGKEKKVAHLFQL